MLAVALDALEHGLRLLRRLAVDAVDDQLGVAEDGVERRAQLVAHVGEELRLVLARLGELAALVLDFVEQPHVLDRDHRLVGERRDQLDLLVGERFELWLALHRMNADRGSLAEQRDAKHCARRHACMARPGVFYYRDRKRHPRCEPAPARSTDVRRAIRRPGSMTRCSMMLLEILASKPNLARWR